MGWLKKLFGKPEVEKLVINLSDAGSWLDERTKPAIDSLNKELAEVMFQIKETIDKLKSDISVLENAELEYKGHVENKVKSVVLGHRTNYIRIITHFIDSLNFPEKIDYKTALEFYSSAINHLNKFSTDSVKTFYTVQHLFHKEVGNIAKTIKLFDKRIRRIRELTEHKNLHLLEDAKSRISSLMDEIKKKGEISKSFEEDELRLLSSKKHRIDFVKRIEGLKKSRDYTSLQDLKQKQELFDNELVSLDSELIQRFSPLGHALRKFQKIALEDNKLILLYLEKPADAVISDDKFRIINILDKLKNNISSDSIELKEKKKEKTLQTIDRIDKNLLMDFLKNHRTLLDKKEQTKKQIKANTILDSIKEIDYKVEHVTNLIDKLKSSIEETAKIIDRIKTDIDKNKSELEEMLKRITGIEIKLII